MFTSRTRACRACGTDNAHSMGSRSYFFIPPMRGRLPRWALPPLFRQPKEFPLKPVS
jgi:hypothetical protein